MFASTIRELRTALMLLSFIVAWSAPFLEAAEAFEVGPTQTNALPRGRMAEGIIGDFVIRNSNIVAVISGNRPFRRANFNTYQTAAGIIPGCLYDLAIRGAENDQLSIFSPAEQIGPVTSVRVAKSGSDGEAVVETLATVQN